MEKLSENARIILSEVEQEAKKAHQMYILAKGKVRERAVEIREILRVYDAKIEAEDVILKPLVLKVLYKGVNNMSEVLSEWNEAVSLLSNAYGKLEELRHTLNSDFDQHSAHFQE